MTQLFLDAVKAKEITKIRSYIISEIKDDKCFEGNEVESCVKYVLEQGVDIFEPYAPTPCETDVPDDTSKWDAKLFFDKVEDLRLNFAYQERIPQIMKIGCTVFEPSTQASFETAPESHRSVSKKTWLPLVLIAGGITIAILIVILLLK